MVTGDHVQTATAIAAEMGFPLDGGFVTGAQLERMSPAELSRAAETAAVFARTSPEQKLRLVEALQAGGAVVAMTGDGVNDAPALKRADVGVAMGLKGTEVAREAAEMVLADDNFASIVNAVEEGRTVFDNITKSILYILPTSIGEALTIIGAVLLGVTLPVTAVQILWVNMVTTVTLALALAFEPAELNIMRRPPRTPAAPILNGFMAWRIVMVSLLMVAAAFGLFILETHRGAGLDSARTVAVNTLVVCEAAYLFNIRFFTMSSLARRVFSGNPWIFVAVVLVMFLQVLFTYLPSLQSVFATQGLDGFAWSAIVLAGAVLFLLVEAEKWVARRRSRAAR
jgi:magnesium-transporting ATPase (P-type)